MKIGFIGYGKVASALSCYISSEEYKVSGVFSNDNTTATAEIDKLETIYITKQHHKPKVYESLVALLDDCDTIFVTTDDDSIEHVTHEIYSYLKDQENQKQSQENTKHSQENKKHSDSKYKMFIHCSGAKSSDVFSSLKSLGHSGCSIHPLQAFTGSTNDLTQLSNTYFTLESEQEIHSLNHMLDRLGNSYTWIKPEQKAIYHASAVMISNYMVTLVHEGFNMLNHIGISSDDAKEMMKPLMESTVKNIGSKGTIQGLTGPIVRGDSGTIRNHVNSLKEYPESFEIYQFMGNRTLSMMDGNLEKEVINIIEQELNSDTDLNKN